jgi:hypothetical protein
MSITLGHLKALVAKYVSQHYDVTPAAGKQAGCCVTQIVKPEIFDSCFPTGAIE